LFFFQAEVGIRDFHVTGVQTCALPIFLGPFGVDVDPLVVVGGVGEGVHPVLGDRAPLGGAERLTDAVLELLDVREGPHEAERYWAGGTAAKLSTRNAPFSAASQ